MEDHPPKSRPTSPKEDLQASINRHRSSLPHVTGGFKPVVLYPEARGDEYMEGAIATTYLHLARIELSNYHKAIRPNEPNSGLDEAQCANEIRKYRDRGVRYDPRERHSMFEMAVREAELKDAVQREIAREEEGEEEGEEEMHLSEGDSMEVQTGKQAEEEKAEASGGGQGTLNRDEKGNTGTGDEIVGHESTDLA